MERYTFLCPECLMPDNQSPPLISFFADEHSARCSRCRRHYSLTTRSVASSIPAVKKKDGRLLYRLTTSEKRGRTRQRRFIALPGVIFDDGDVITLVKRGGRLLGVANQTSRRWWLLPEPMTDTRTAVSAKVALLAAVIVALALLPPLFNKLRALLENPGPSMLIAGVIVAIFALSLPLSWILEQRSQDLEEKTRII